MMSFTPGTQFRAPGSSSPRCTPGFQTEKELHDSVDASIQSFYFTKKGHAMPTKTPRINLNEPIDPRSFRRKGMLCQRKLLGSIGSFRLYAFSESHAFSSGRSGLFTASVVGSYMHMRMATMRYDPIVT